jgi:hypothetical protein
MDGPPGADGLDLTPDAAALTPGSPGGAMPVTGILGESPEDSSVRIYLDAAFTTFYDVPKDAVQERRRVDAADSAFGVAATVLYVKQGTEITVQHTSSRTIDDEFLAGDFTAPGSFLALTSFQGPGAATGRVAWIPTITQFDCRTCEQCH